jgi:hypothetical protein
VKYVTNLINMTKFIKSLIASSVILALNVVQIATSKHPFSNLGLLSMGLTLVLVIGIPVIVWIEMKTLRQGKPMVDELSKMVGLKASEKSYYLSFLSWGTVFGISEYFKYDIGTFFMIGTAAMLVIGLLSWLYYKIKGVKDV